MNPTERLSRGSPIRAAMIAGTLIAFFVPENALAGSVEPDEHFEATTQSNEIYLVNSIIAEGHQTACIAVMRRAQNPLALRVNSDGNAGLGVSPSSPPQPGIHFTKAEALIGAKKVQLDAIIHGALETVVLDHRQLDDALKSGLTIESADFTMSDFQALYDRDMDCLATGAN